MPKWLRSARAFAQEEAVGALTIGPGLVTLAAVVPAGMAWQQFLSRHDRPVLHDRDQSHPTLAGSYLAACAYLAVLFEQNPVGIDAEIAGSAEEDRVLLQKAAWQ